MKICSKLDTAEMKVKLQWDITTHLLELPQWKLVLVSNTGKDVEKLIIHTLLVRM